MTDRYLYGGKSDIGYKRKINEDYINIIELHSDTLLAIIADGSGSTASALNPASIVVSEIAAIVKRIYEEDKELFIENSELFLKEAMYAANRVLGAFKLGNDELYAGFGASATCCLISNNVLTFAHSGNTRLHLLRINQEGAVKTIQLTIDQTKAKEMIDQGILPPELYYSSPESLVLTSGLGFFTEPNIQTFSTAIQSKDFILLTTDGIHYAINSDAMTNLILAGDNCDAAADALIQAALQQKYNDNMSAIIIFNKGNEKGEAK